METGLGLILFVVYIACVVAAAAGVTWLVVRLSPGGAAGRSAKTSDS